MQRWVFCHRFEVSFKIRNPQLSPESPWGSRSIYLCNALLSRTLEWAGAREKKEATAPLNPHRCTLFAVAFLAATQRGSDGTVREITRLISHEVSLSDPDRAQETFKLNTEGSKTTLSGRNICELTPNSTCLPLSATKLTEAEARHHRETIKSWWRTHPQLPNPTRVSLSTGKN